MGCSLLDHRIGTAHTQMPISKHKPITRDPLLSKAEARRQNLSCVETSANSLAGVNFKRKEENELEYVGKF